MQHYTLCKNIVVTATAVMRDNNIKIVPRSTFVNYLKAAEVFDLLEPVLTQVLKDTFGNNYKHCQVKQGVWRKAVVL